MGAFMLIPGVSGGTIAIVLGAYDEIIVAISNFREDFKANGILLLRYFAGGVTGAALFSGFMLDALEAWTKPLLFFFMGAITAGVPPMYAKVRVSKLKLGNVAAAFVGAASAVATRHLPEGLFTPEGNSGAAGAALLLAAGFVIAIALILPGISGSYVLLMLGMYDMTLAAFNRAELNYLLPLGAGVLAGVFSTAKVLDKQMHKRPQLTYMLIIGFMAGSVIQIFPGLPAGPEVLLCLAALLCGFGLIFWLSRLTTASSPPPL